MALSTVTSQRELARVAQLCYEGRHIRVSLAYMTSQGYTSESNRSLWDSVKVTGGGYTDYTATLAAGTYDAITDNRYELPAVNALFTASAPGFTATHHYAVLGTSSTSTISNVALTTNVATITTSAAHGYSTGNVVTISGLSQTVLNGTYTITGTPLSTTFTYDRTNANITSVASAGTAVVVTEDTNIFQLGTFTPEEIWAAAQSKTIQIPISVDD
jgi:hypothetical protein